MWPMGSLQAFQKTSTASTEPSQHPARSISESVAGSMESRKGAGLWLLPPLVKSLLERGCTDSFWHLNLELFHIACCLILEWMDANCKEAAHWETHLCTFRNCFWLAQAALSHPFWIGVGSSYVISCTEIQGLTTEKHVFSSPILIFSLHSRKSEQRI